jgi:purine-nucleoside phosphorylase
MNNEWKRIDELAQALEQEFGSPPDIAITLGSGLGQVADMLVGKKTLQTAKLPHFPSSTVKGHAGLVHKGAIGKTNILILQGRIHLYEGYQPFEIVRPLRAAISWGTSTIMLTNAAGGIHPDLRPGNLMLIKDHLNLTGANPLVGLEQNNRGQQFPDMTNLYDIKLRALALKSAKKLKIDLKEGIYAGLLGPSYETPAEVRMLAGLGATAVGMSTVLEAIAARHLKARVIGISCITNAAAGLDGAILDHREVQLAGQRASGDMAHLIENFARKMGAKN